VKAIKHILRVALIVGWIAGCSGMQPHLGGGNAGGPVLNAIVQRGELRVGCAGDMPPLNMVTKEGALIGMEIDLAELIADAMGVAPKLVTMPFAELLPALEAGRIDMIISNMTMTAKRNLRVAFVGPYFVSGKALLTRFKTVAAVKDPAELNHSKTTLSTLEGSTSRDFARDFMPEAMVYAAGSYTEAVQMVVDGRVDAMLADYPICVVSVWRFPDAGLISLISPLTREPIGIAVPAGDPLLVNWLENYLEYLDDTEVLDAMRERWFSRGAWLERLP